MTEYLWRYRYPPDEPDGPIDMLLLPIEGEKLPTHPDDDDRGETTIVWWGGDR